MCLVRKCSGATSATGKIWLFCCYTGGRKRGQANHKNHDAEGGGHAPRLKMVANLESKGGGTLGELDVLCVISSIAAAQVGTAERRRLRTYKKRHIGLGQ